MFVDLELWIMIGILFLLFFFGLFFLGSVSQSKKIKKHRPKPLTQKEQKEWKEAALHLEKQLLQARRENIDVQKQAKVLQKELDIYKEKNTALKEKLDRERGWQKKEEQDIDKQGRHLQELQHELKAMETRFETEHSELILLRREKENFKEEIDRAAAQIKSLQEQADKAQAFSDSLRKEMLDLRAQNKVLSKRHEDVQWIARSVHLKVKEELRQKTEELEALKKKMGNP
ncbi:MAG TPA: hypothetical protein VLJ10_01170 [Candidatus Bathyarchaeia archaeon]|nr:hypothetical protein [Candidatus Bathyarchaeia archaeon]